MNLGRTATFRLTHPICIALFTWMKQIEGVYISQMENWRYRSEASADSPLLCVVNNQMKYFATLVALATTVYAQNGSVVRIYLSIFK